MKSRFLLGGPSNISVCAQQVFSPNRQQEQDSFSPCCPFFLVQLRTYRGSSYSSTFLHLLSPLLPFFSLWFRCQSEPTSSTSHRFLLLFSTTILFIFSVARSPPLLMETNYEAPSPPSCARGEGGWLLRMIRHLPHCVPLKEGRGVE